METRQEPLITDPVTEPRPVAEHERILTLDVLRGIALLGILFVNMQVFAMPLAKFYGTPALAEAPASSQWAWAFVHIFCQYKFISIFSLLFGVGLAVALSRAQRANRPFAATYLRRIFVLGVVGAVHGFLLWYGDILLIYAVLGLGLLVFARLGPKPLIAIAAGLLAINVVLSAGFNYMQAFGKQMQADQAAARQVANGSETNTDTVAADEPQRLAGLDAMTAANFDPMHPAWMEAETRAMRDGPWSEAMMFRSVTMGFNIALIFVLGWGILGLFLLGAALMKLGFFQPEFRRWHIMLAVVGLGVGLPLEAYSAWLMYRVDWHWNFTFAWALTIHDIARLFMLAGYVGGITLLVTTNVLGRLVYAFASVGRMALTSYLLQTIIATAIMYHWGLAMFGEFSRPQQLLLTVAIYAAQIVFSILWLRFFRFGPMEWLWRSATYGRLPAMTR